MQTDTIALSPTDTQTFRTLIWDYYRDHGRSFPWRHSHNPYHIVVSEIMLQQTQTDRVIEKYENFLHRFPTLNALAQASLKDVLVAWQGLGYNRRGMYLHNAVKIIVESHDGIVPCNPEELQKLPGIGHATARSICAFAFNLPTIFIETNIRAVFIHTFFAHQHGIDDKLLMPVIAQTVDDENPREWYYALMDYGVMLKKKYPNPSRKSKHHALQSKFDGSDRQIRGALIRLLLDQPYTRAQLPSLYAADQERILRIVDKMISENIIRENNAQLTIE